MRLGVLVSGRGSNLAALLSAAGSGRLPRAEIAVVVSNNPGVPALEVAFRAGVASHVVDHRLFGGNRLAHEAAILAILGGAGCEALILAGYRRLLAGPLLEAFPERILNVHPSLLPAFPGLHAPAQAIRAGAKVSGCTVHFVDAGLDSGPIVGQRAVAIEPWDTEQTLSDRILEQEHEALVEAVDWLTCGRLIVEQGRVRIVPRSEGMPPP